MKKFDDEDELDDELEKDKNTKDEDDDSDWYDVPEEDNKEDDSEEGKESTKTKPVEEEYEYNEQETVEFTSKKLFKELESLGLEFEEDFDPNEHLPEKTFSGLAQTIQDLIKDASTPRYSDSIVKELDEYVARGGSPERFMQHYLSQDNEEYSLDTMQDKQKTLVDYFIKIKGFSEEKAIRFLKKYDDEELERDAEEAYSELKKHQEQHKSLLQKELELKQQKQKEQEKAEFANLNRLIENNDPKEIGFKFNSDVEKKKFANFVGATEGKMSEEYINKIKSIPNFNLRVAYMVHNNLLDEQGFQKFIKTLNASKIEEKIPIIKKKK